MQVDFELVMLLCCSANLVWSIAGTLKSKCATSKHLVTVTLVTCGATFGVLARLEAAEVPGVWGTVQIIALANLVGIVCDIAVTLYYSRQHRSVEHSAAMPVSREAA